jgi:hypothetical protein
MALRTSLSEGLPLIGQEITKNILSQMLPNVTCFWLLTHYAVDIHNRKLL